ncbi:hypothetical protein Patl1_14538 [Pistacia atlantica]|uniref:Uncharacterized protein n=1 Tax=Pistacia atlantica TaxID=434234 RepID=A0ACC1AV29_9ROSI|nr:hypothetical protein Patl1_14538 [Pistacia atlantica]
MLGHAEFVQELLGRMPELAGELDSCKSSPLHLATSKGYLDIVKKLVSVNPEMCLVRDMMEKNPAHIAVIKGHDDDGNTILHLTVADKQVERGKARAPTSICTRSSEKVRPISNLRIETGIAQY